MNAPKQVSNSRTTHSTAYAAQSLVRRLIQDVINDEDYTVLHELLHDDYIYRAPGETLKGRASLQALFTGYRVALPDLNIQIDNIFGDGTQVATAFTLTGTHAGPLMDIPPTGRSVSVSGIVHSRVEEGRIVEEWELIDMATLIQQLENPERP